MLDTLAVYITIKLVSLTRPQVLSLVLHISNLSIIHLFKVLPAIVLCSLCWRLESSSDQLVGGLDLENSASFLLGGIQRARRLMPNERAALSSQKTQNKQDEVIETTAVLMMMAPSLDYSWLSLYQHRSSSTPTTSHWLFDVCLIKILLCDCVQIWTKTELYSI